MDHATDCVTWRCPVKVYKKRIRIRQGIFVEKSHLQLWQTICGAELLENQGECPVADASLSSCGTTDSKTILTFFFRLTLPN